LTAPASPVAGGRRWRAPPTLVAILVAAIIGAGLIALSGANPLDAYEQIVIGSLAPENLPDTLNWATPLVGMTLAAALPLRSGQINLGGDGQLVIGGLVAAVVAYQAPVPGPLAALLALAAAAAAGGLYAALAAFAEIAFAIPMLISSLLLSYPALGVVSYLARFPLRDVTTGLPQTAMIPAGARLMTLAGPFNVGAALIAVLAIFIVFVDRRTVAGFELRMRGLNARFAGYAGVGLARQTVLVMFASGALAGLVGAIVVLGSQFRFIDAALTSPNYTWSGLMAALLADGEPVGAICAGLFFAALQTGGFAMQRETTTPRVLTLALQAIVILFLAVRGGLNRRAQ
jgi:general nucleoside transport system permease protein